MSDRCPLGYLFHFTESEKRDASGRTKVKPFTNPFKSTFSLFQDSASGVMKNKTWPAKYM